MALKFELVSFVGLRTDVGAVALALTGCWRALCKDWQASSVFLAFSSVIANSASLGKPPQSMISAWVLGLFMAKYHKAPAAFCLVTASASLTLATKGAMPCASRMASWLVKLAAKCNKAPAAYRLVLALASLSSATKGAIPCASRMASWLVEFTARSPKASAAFCLVSISASLSSATKGAMP